MVFEFEIIIIFFELDHVAVTWIKCAIGQAVFVSQKCFLFRRIKTRVSGFVKLSRCVKF